MASTILKLSFLPCFVGVLASQRDSLVFGLEVAGEAEQNLDWVARLPAESKLEALSRAVLLVVPATKNSGGISLITLIILQ